MRGSSVRIGSFHMFNNAQESFRLSRKLQQEYIQQLKDRIQQLSDLKMLLEF